MMLQQWTLLIWLTLGKPVLEILSLVWHLTFGRIKEPKLAVTMQLIELSLIKMEKEIRKGWAL